MDLLAGNLIMILCFLAGTGLILVEAFMPGFGIAGVFGVVMEIVAITFAWMNHGTVFALIATLLVLLLTGLAVYLSLRSAVRGRLSKSPLILKEEEATPVPEENLARWIKKKGQVVTALRPAGTVAFDGERIPAVSEGAFLEKGTPVVGVSVRGSELVVRSQQPG